MVDDREGRRTVEDQLKVAAHHRNAMVERRNIGLKIIVGVVTFDLLVMKLALDAANRVHDVTELTWATRSTVLGAFIALSGMLFQVEVRSRHDRIVARTAERRVRAELEGERPEDVPEQKESVLDSLRQSWAATWPLLGVCLLTISLWWFAGLIIRPV